MANAQEITLKTLKLPLGETPVKVGVYEKAGARITFFAPHRNERIALSAAQEAVAENGGRLVAIESFDRNGNPARRLAFKLKGKSYTIDPNRIYTANGRRCAGLGGDAERAVADFAEKLLAIVFPAQKRLPEDEKFIVAVHNNSDADDKSPALQAGDLTAAAFVGNAAAAGRVSRGAFAAQAAGAYLSNAESDVDNFIFLSSPRYLGFFVRRNFSVVVQKSAAQLASAQCGIDDGSLSVYAGQRGIEYICLEADAAKGKLRQKQMLAAVFRLSGKAAGNESEPDITQSDAQK